MAYVICEPCIGVKATKCVEVCPVDAIHPRPDEEGFAEVEQLFIDPESCIDCGACAAVCPEEAVFAEEDLPEKWGGYIAKNADHFK
jgi:ferredoxin